MCNLNILIKTKFKDVSQFMQSISSVSYLTNSDGDGIYTSFNNAVVKSLKKVDYISLSKEINHSKFIITHQRLATSGYECEYTHPFENDEFVLVHNGVINEFKKDIGSDTYGFFTTFIDTFEDLNVLKDRETRVIKTIELLLSKIKYGYFSVFIYDKVSKTGYYFKDDRTTINFYQGEDFVYITTHNKTPVFLNLITSNDVDELQIEDYNIYKIKIINEKSSKKSILVESICELEQHKDDKQSKLNNWWEVSDADYV